VIWYKFHLGDYITHTTHLSDAEDLAYRRLLDLYYISEAPIPSDTAFVARKIRLDLDITESKPNTNPNKIKNKNKNTLSATRFEEFWAAWPSSKRKVGKAAVLVKWERGGLDDVADAIIANVNDLKSSEQWTSGFEPAPLTYINQRRWEDDAGTPAVSRRVI